MPDPDGLAGEADSEDSVAVRDLGALNPIFCISSNAVFSAALMSTDLHVSSRIVDMCASQVGHFHATERRASSLRSSAV